MWTRKFWKGLLERGIKTFAQSAAALLVVNAATPLDVNWTTVAAVAGLAAGISALTSIGSLPVGEPDSASAVEQ